MKRVVKIIGYVSAVALLLAACSKDAVEQETIYNLRGKIEKGPFVQGSKVSIYELSASLVPTGRGFIAQTGIDDGSFSLDEVKLISPFVRLDADGYYFNEVSGKLSVAPLNLTAVADLRQSSTVNVNLLTHLERQRVEKLLRDGKNFAQAKAQAQQELLAVFGLSVNAHAEQAELCGNDATLLAVSSILQGFRTEAELTVLLAALAQEIAQNGELTNKGIYNALSNEAARLSATDIKNNLSAWYQGKGIQVNVPDLAPALNAFLEHCPPAGSGITYPATGKYGINLLSTEGTTRFSGRNDESYGCSLSAELEPGAHLKVIFYGKCAIEEIPIAATDTTTATVIVIEKCASFGREITSVEGWSFGAYDIDARTQRVTIAGKASGDAHIILSGKGEIWMDIYENGAVIPTRKKIIVIE